MSLKTNTFLETKEHMGTTELTTMTKTGTELLNSWTTTTRYLNGFSTELCSWQNVLLFLWLRMSKVCWIKQLSSKTSVDMQCLRVKSLLGTL